VIERSERCKTVGFESIELVAHDGLDPPEPPPVEALLAPTFNGIQA
jgi:hypothetical protein